MNADLNIDLSGIPDVRWREREERCAYCRRFFETIREDPMAEDDGGVVPLLLWRNDGKEMLRLCWPCAEKRMSTRGIMSGAE